MKTMKMCLTAVLLYLAFAGTSFSKEEHKKEWSQTYQVNADATLETINKFGMIHVTTWDQNSIQIDVIITVDVSSDSKAQDILEAITIEDESSASHVKLETIFKKNKTNNSDLSIDYTIKAPVGVSLDLNNSFGDIFVGTTQGAVKVKLSYGSLKGEKLSSDQNDIDIAFGNGEMDGFGGGTANLEYGNFSIDHCGDAEITSAFSSLEIDMGGNLVVQSEYDKYSIDELESLEMDAQFTSIEVDRIERRVEIDSEYSGIEVDEISADFEEVHIESQFGGVEIGFDEGASYTLEASSKMGGIDYPKGMKVTDHDEEMLSESIEGVVGSNPGTKKVYIKVSQAGIDIE